MRFIYALMLCWLGSTTAKAVTISQTRASETATVLTSPAIAPLLLPESGVGEFESISFVPSTTEASNYALRFLSYSVLGEQICTVSASIQGVHIVVGSPSCKVKGSEPSLDSNVCMHPSPV